MAYQPPTSSKYGPALQIADPNKPSPFARTRAGFNANASSAFQSRPTEAASTDWTSFGANKRARAVREEAATPRAPIVDTQRNSLSAFVQAATGALPPAPEEKWSQSAIRRPAAKSVAPAPEKSYEDLFPTLGKKTPSSSNLAMAKSESTESLSFADLMKKRVREEEEANRLRALEEERLARQREEEERQNHMMGIVRRIRLGNNVRAFDTPDDDEMEGDDNDLDADVYGFRRTTYANDEYDDDIRSTTPPYYA